jgi:hypothetical protein
MLFQVNLLNNLLIIIVIIEAFKFEILAVLIVYIRRYTIIWNRTNNIGMDVKIFHDYAVLFSI